MYKNDLQIIVFFRSLDQLQKASEKREAMEKKLRAKLEDELMELRQAQTGNSDPNLRPGDSIEEFRRKLSDAEEKVLMTKLIMTQFSCSYTPPRTPRISRS